MQTDLPDYCRDTKKYLSTGGVTDPFRNLLHNLYNSSIHEAFGKGPLSDSVHSVNSVKMKSLLGHYGGCAFSADALSEFETFAFFAFFAVKNPKSDYVNSVKKLRGLRNLRDLRAKSASFAISALFAVKKFTSILFILSKPGLRFQRGTDQAKFEFSACFVVKNPISDYVHSVNGEPKWVTPNPLFCDCRIGHPMPKLSV
jgi:hypothetical protein